MLTEAEVKEIVETHQIPVATGTGAGWMGPLSLSFDENPIITISEHSAVPTDQELQQLVAFRERRVRGGFPEDMAENILSQPDPGHPGFNTYLFIKVRDWGGSGRDGWAYRQISWDSSLYLPGRDVAPWTLTQLLQFIEK